MFCNGVIVSERELLDGDVILLGKACSTSIVFRQAGAEAAGKKDSVFLNAFSDTSLYMPPTSGDSSPGGPSRLQSLARFLDLSRTLSGRLSSAEVVEAVVDMAIEITKADRGPVVLVRDNGLEFVAVRGRGATSLTAAPKISETLVREVLEKKT